TVTATATNSPPTASAGVGQSVLVGATVTLDGSASTDPQGDPLSYDWTLDSRPAGSAAVLSSASAMRPSFVADVAGAYTATLTVSDGQASSNAASVTVTAGSDEPTKLHNLLPVQSLTPATQAVTVGSTASVDGSASFDPEGQPVTYIWTFVKPTGSNAVLQQGTSARPSFVPDIPGVYYLILSVSDGQAFSKSKSVATINVSAP
ncbi:MAG: PKD domain-containing protein, partial [Ideonella sp.]|nr:PKD domain-containing protein [Ideonella sp.]